MSERFEKSLITLEKDTHKYILSSSPSTKFVSVTKIVEKFFQKFDSNKIAEKLINNHPKYSNYTIESLINEWDQKARHGTEVHDQIEKWIKFGTIPYEKKAIHGKNWLEKYKSNSDFKVFSEIIIYSIDLSIAGTIDVIAEDKKTGLIDIIDWKTSKKIDFNSYQGKMGNHPITNNIMDCNFFHYSLQLSLYRYILERYYGLNIRNQMIVHLTDDGSKVIDTPYMRTEIVKMVNLHSGE